MFDETALLHIERIGTHAPLHEILALCKAYRAVVAERDKAIRVTRELRMRRSSESLSLEALELLGEVSPAQKASA